MVDPVQSVEGIARADLIVAEVMAYCQIRHHEAQELARLIIVRLDAALDAAGYAVERKGWQPIETAPKDGSEILILAHGMAIQARFEPGRWSEDTPVSPAEYDGAVWCAFDDAQQFEIEEGAGENGGDWHGAVTHWMPLPAPPTITASRHQEGKHGA